MKNNNTENTIISSSSDISSSIIKSYPIGIIVINETGHIQTINKVALEVFDLNKDSVSIVGSTNKATLFIDILPKSEQLRWQSLINIVFATNLQITENRFPYCTSYLEKILSLKIVPLDKKQSDSILISVEDITERITKEKFHISLVIRSIKRN